jgi:hypothetical protein
VYFFEEGGVNNNVLDGGNNLFDGGNFIICNSHDLEKSLTYSDNFVQLELRLGRIGKYFTRKVPGLFVFASDIIHQPLTLSYIFIYDDLGLDGGGVCLTANSYLTINGVDWDYMWINTFEITELEADAEMIKGILMARDNIHNFYIDCNTGTPSIEV